MRARLANDDERKNLGLPDGSIAVEDGGNVHLIDGADGFKLYLDLRAIFGKKENAGRWSPRTLAEAGACCMTDWLGRGRHDLTCKNRQVEPQAPDHSECVHAYGICVHGAKPDGAA